MHVFLTNEPKAQRIVKQRQWTRPSYSVPELKKPWLYNYLSTHPKLKTTPARLIEAVRQLCFVATSYLLNVCPTYTQTQERVVTREEVRNWFATLKSLGEFDPRLIFNVDETFLAPGSKKQRVVIVRGTTTRTVGVHTLESYNEHMTLVLCISAAGAVAPYSLVLPFQHATEEMAKVFPCSTFTGSAKGWVDREIFDRWAQGVFIPFINKIRTEIGTSEARALLILDGHNSRSNSDLLSTLAQSGITVACMPSHASHILQPLDLVVFSVLKGYLSKYVDFKGLTDMPSKRLALLDALRRALYHTVDPDTLQDSFKKAGIWPFNPDAVLVDNDLLSKDSVVGKPSSTRTGAFISGKILTAEDVIQEIRSKELQAASRREQKVLRAMKRKKCPSVAQFPPPAPQ